MTSIKENKQNKHWYLVEIEAFKEEREKDFRLEEKYKDFKLIMAPDGLIPNSIAKQNFLEFLRKNNISTEL